MSVTLHDATAKTFSQILTSIKGVLAKGREHCEANGIDLDSVVNFQLYEDMLPFRFQVVSVAHHSLGALQGVEAGLFGPPRPADEDYAALENLVASAYDGVQAFTEEKVNGFEDGDMVFKMGQMEMPFKAQDFLLTFTLPNFYFHATTTYDMIRMQGAKIGKRDFLGQLRLNMG